MTPRIRTSRVLFCAAATIGLLVAASPVRGQAAVQRIIDKERNHAMTMKDDLANRATAIHWPEGFDPSQAELFSHSALLIQAPCERVWSHIVDAAKWPEWYPNSKDVHLLNGATMLQAGGVFRWTTFSIRLESRINEFVPFARIGWYGYAPGAEPSFYHTWYLQPRGHSCLVVTDEVGKGKDAKQLRETDEALMHRGHDLWLATLKWVSENR
jgi:uncharacterized protein YndB with AHSA1/START domain